MSSRTWPSSGYVIEAAKLAALLPESVRGDYERMLDLDREDAEYDQEAVQEFLQEHLPGRTPSPSSVFILGGDDSPGDQLEEGVWYAYYDESDLYEKTLTAEAREMQTLLGELPTREEWGIYG
jgi:hypothetical protein